MRSSPFAALDARLAPAPAPRRIAFFSDVAAFAHRGLWSASAPENSLAAARAAIGEGHGIECDVRLSRDGTPHLFHDADAQRMCGDPRPMVRMGDADIAGLRLAGTREPVPTLAALLALVDGRVPLLIELKGDRTPVAALCRAVRRALHGYRGAVAVMGFDPRVSRWFARHAPHIAHGLILTEHRDGRAQAFADSIRRRLAVWRAKPDFLSYDIRFLPSALPAALRSRGLPLVTWTVRTGADRARADACGAIPTFERA